VNKGQSSAKLVAIFESLSDVTLTVLADFLADPAGGGLPVVLHLADIGVSVFAVGVVGEDDAGQKVFQALQQHKISTSGISRIKSYATPTAAGGGLIHGEHPALLNLIEHARKFASASDGMYVCDHGIGAASPRTLNFIKSNGCLREKSLVARSPLRLTEFEQLTSGIAYAGELEQAIGIEIEDDAEKLAVAAEGMMLELHAASFVALGDREMVVLNQGHDGIVLPGTVEGGPAIDLMGGFFAAALAADAEPKESAELAAKLVGFFLSRSGEKRTRREEVLEFLSATKASRQVR